MTRILVVEDDPGVGDALVRTVQRAGWEASLATRLAEARTRLFSERWDLVVLDVRLPDGDGRTLCREIVASGGPAIIFVTARSDEVTLVEGLALGAEDYIVKPVRAAELVARIRVVLRRGSAADRRAPSPELHVGPLRLDRARRVVTLDATQLDLTPTEYVLLLTLATRAGEVVSREDLAAAAWGDAWDPSPKALDMHMSGLRRKLGESRTRRRLLRTARGVGYRLEAPEPD